MDKVDHHAQVHIVPAQQGRSWQVSPNLISKIQLIVCVWPFWWWQCRYYIRSSHTLARGHRDILAQATLRWCQPADQPLIIIWFAILRSAVKHMKTVSDIKMTGAAHCYTGHTALLLHLYSTHQPMLAFCWPSCLAFNWHLANHLCRQERSACVIVNTHIASVGHILAGL